MFHDLPGFLAYAGDPGLAMLSLVFLLLAGCLSALADPQAPFRTAPAPKPPLERD